MSTRFDPTQVERLNRAHVDLRAREFVARSGNMPVPHADLAIFFRRMGRRKRMLDLGCAWARYGDEFTNRGLEYHGVDLSPVMIELARDRFPALDFKVMSYRKLDFPDNSFDGVWVCSSLIFELKANMPNVLKEIKRVMVGKGVFSIVEPKSFMSNERILNDRGVPFFQADWEFIEFEEVLIAAGFKILESYDRDLNGAMSFHVRPS